MKTITIDHRRIGPADPPYIIAELSANHGGSFERAKKIVRLAAECGADAIKFQAYSADALTIDSNRPDFIINSGSLWDGQRLFDLYESAAMPYEWFDELFALARELGITPFASAFDLAAIDVLERLDAPAYKIASFEANDLELVTACLKTGKPVIVSTGLCTLQDVLDIVGASELVTGSQLALLKCNSAYPARLAEVNLSVIPDMIKRFGLPIGYSDHTLGVTTAVAACALGACIIEKHFIDAPAPETADSAFSITPVDFRTLVASCHDAFLVRGEAVYGPATQERRSTAFRRSLYVVAEVAQGGALTRDNIRSIRPGFGLPPKHLGSVIGRTAARRLERGEPLGWDMIQ